MICDHKPNCPHCKVLATLDEPEMRSKWDSLLKAFQMFPRAYDIPEDMFRTRAESIRTAKPFGRRV